MKTLLPLFFLVATTAFGAAGDVIFKQINPSGTAITDRVLANPSAIRVYGLNSSAGTWRPTQFALGTGFSVAGAFGSQTLNFSDPGGPYQPLDTDLTVIAGLTPSNNDVLQRKSGAWTNRTLSQYWTDLMADPGPASYSYTALPFTINTDKRLLGRDNAIPPGVAQEISIGTGLTLSSSTLSLDSSAAVTSIAGTAAEITASASVGAVTLSLPTALTFTGKTATGGTFNGGAFNGTVGATTPSTVGATDITMTVNSGTAVGSRGAFRSILSGTDGTSWGFMSASTIASGGGTTSLGAEAGTDRANASRLRLSIEPAGSYATIISDASGTGVAQKMRLVAPTSIEIEITGTGTVGTFTTTGINNTAIGATTPSTVAATTVNTTGNITITKSIPALFLSGTEGSARNVSIYENAGLLRIGETGVSDRVTIDIANGNTLSNGTITGTTIISTVVVRLKGYTVATLPAGTQGDTAYVTDALAPAFLAVVVGGGSVVTPVFYNGTNWVGH